jgi:SAM-dependent methyltransferase
MEEKEIKKAVRKRYGEIAKKSSSCCGTSNKKNSIETSCCGNANTDIMSNLYRVIGYTDDELQSAPLSSNLGLGCGNPLAHANIKEGDTVLDLGSGAGLDCFLAAKRVGKTGKVIGVDMTPDMIDKARDNALKSNYDNVEFRLGEIEHLPVADNSIDLIISNCVINLAPNKEQVFQDAYRVLKSGGKLMISDMVLLKELPNYIKNSIDAYIGCVSGALLKEDYISIIKKVGFSDVNILSQLSFPVDIIKANPDVIEKVKELGIPSNELENLAKSVVSIKIEARK